MRHKFIPVLLVLFIATSCAGLRKYRSYTRIVSDKPGVTVYNEDKQIIGETPFLYHLPNQRKHIFYLKEGGNWIRLSHKCKWNISATILVDGLSKCESDIKVPSRGKLTLKNKGKILPILPEIQTSEQGEVINQFLIKQGLSIKDYNKHSRFFQKYGIFPNSRKLTHMQTKTLDFLLKSYGYNQLIIFEKQENGYTPLRIDIFTNKVLQKYEPIALQRYSSRFELVLNLFEFLPNAFALNYFFQGRIGGDERTLGFEQKLRSDKRDLSSHPDGFPKYFPLISIENIIYPYKFETFDFKFNFSPSFNSYSFRYTDSLNGQNYVLEAQSYLIHYNAYLNFIHPLGTTTLGMGIGAGYLNASDNQTVDFSKFHSGIRSTVFHTVFLNDRIFSQLGVNLYTLPEEFHKTSQGPFLPQNYTEFFFSVGYYFPEFKSLSKNYLLN
jgi:hypothetical protein